jgi:hypothetical protein
MSRRRYSVRDALARAKAEAAFKPRPAAAVEVRVVKLPTLSTEDRAVKRRRAGETAVTLAPVSFSAPAEDTFADVQAFVVEQFREAKRKRKRRAA